jgi:hypothetical protein
MFESLKKGTHQLNICNKNQPQNFNAKVFLHTFFINCFIFL